MIDTVWVVQIAEDIGTCRLTRLDQVCVCQEVRVRALYLQIGTALVLVCHIGLDPESTVHVDTTIVVIGVLIPQDRRTVEALAPLNTSQRYVRNAVDWFEIPVVVRGHLGRLEVTQEPGTAWELRIRVNCVDAQVWSPQCYDNVDLLWVICGPLSRN